MKYDERINIYTVIFACDRVEYLFLLSSILLFSQDLTKTK